ncbi:deoxyinosine 3'endonuclease (endonuclease V) [Bernardetia litoralis DSM 6794]|uniref:Deoxyinosine 3'endonuclease (Endonuclease V) n=1 Tax=Bernardetia litoralis (strain ATCC 23117 / DSM 6794 / NBRC 15988 / NCIMB 1366 / Fx l1 / Sio-4) TaxID=880071 RepID=I4AKG6_BERLS|nr:endonuclease V [Bernardetia litoralis]AFM04451.1 deoxyinosine 3'endonuclease (endonuclease V) [Bernardetia litoralis DSM 6794]
MEDLIKKLTDFQNQLAPSIWIPIDAEPIYPEAILGAIDVQYEGENGFAAIVIFDRKGKILHTFTRKYKATIPYIPSFFAFREGDIIIKLVRDAEKELHLNIDILLIDGHGIAHPRKFGLASYVGLALEKMSIGVAKNTLLKYNGILSKGKDSSLDIYLDQATKNELVGYVYRSREDVKPIFVSAGHKLSSKQALEITKEHTGEYRQLDVLREADRLAREAAKGDIN